MAANSPLEILLDLELRWIRPAFFVRRFELHGGGRILATLDFHGLLGPWAAGTWDGDEWEFRRAGFPRGRIAVRSRKAGSAEDLALFLPNLWNRGGSLVLADGRRFTAAATFLGTSVELRDDRDQTVLRIDRQGLFRPTGLVRLQRRALELPEARWMILLAWLLLVRRRKHGHPSP